MRAACLERSPRLQRVHALLSDGVERLTLGILKIAPKTLLDLRRQRVHAAPPGCQPYPPVAGNRDRRRSRTASVGEHSGQRRGVHRPVDEHTQATGQRILDASLRWNAGDGILRRRPAGRRDNHRHESRAAGIAILLSKG